MYPYVRLGYTLLKERRSTPIGMFDVHWSEHRAWPWDTDMFGELNNGRILTLFELGRWGVTQRTGFMGLIFKHKLAFAVAGASVHYRRRIPIFAKYQMRTHFLGFDDKFMYVDQSMWMGDVACNQLLLRAAFTKNRKLFAPSDALDLYGQQVASPKLPDWVQNWSDADATRPWPPIV